MKHHSLTRGFNPAVPPEEIDELYRAMRRVVEEAQETLRDRVPPTFEKQIRDFLAVHGHGGSPCPRCGTRISEIKAGRLTIDQVKNGIPPLIERWNATFGG